MVGSRSLDCAAALKLIQKFPNTQHPGNFMEESFFEKAKKFFK
jgi:hypothetical protein